MLLSTKKGAMVRAADAQGNVYPAHIVTSQREESRRPAYELAAEAHRYVEADHKAGGFALEIG